MPVGPSSVARNGPAMTRKITMIMQCCGVYTVPRATSIAPECSITAAKIAFRLASAASCFLAQTISSP